jgi:hypothetical protein
MLFVALQIATLVTCVNAPPLVALRVPYTV